MKHWPATTLTLGWLLAAVVLFMAGMHVGTTNSDGPRYVDCRTADLFGQAVWVCPMKGVP